MHAARILGVVPFAWGLACGSSEPRAAGPPTLPPADAGAPRDGAAVPAVAKRCSEGEIPECERRCAAGSGASCLTAGRGHWNKKIPSEEENATALFARGCDLGDGPSCLWLARAYCLGQGAPRDERKALDAAKRECTANDHAYACEMANTLKSHPGICTPERIHAILRAAD